jgi:hypothetical protein
MQRDHKLDTVEGFAPDVVTKLREELSVNTAEQFVDLASHHREAIRNLLDVDSNHLDDLLGHAASVIPHTELREILQPVADDYPFATGHDSPVDAETFYGGESKDD